jgi:hypothetical protein
MFIFGIWQWNVKKVCTNTSIFSAKKHDTWKWHICFNKANTCVRLKQKIRSISLFHIKWEVKAWKHPSKPFHTSVLQQNVSQLHSQIVLSYEKIVSHHFHETFEMCSLYIWTCWECIVNVECIVQPKVHFVQRNSQMIISRDDKKCLFVKKYNIFGFGTLEEWLFILCS